MRRRWLPVLAAGLAASSLTAVASPTTWPELPAGLIEAQITTGGQTVYLNQCFGPRALEHYLQQYSGVEQPCGAPTRTRVGSVYREEVKCPLARGRHFLLRTEITHRTAQVVEMRTTASDRGRTLIDVQQRLVHRGACEPADVLTGWGRVHRPAALAGAACGAACPGPIDAPAAAPPPDSKRWSNGR